MAFDCCDIPSYLPSFPPSQREDLQTVLCKMFQPTADNFVCETVKGCETLTSIEQFAYTDNNTKLTLKYKDEAGVTNTFSVLLSTLSPNVQAANGTRINTLDGKVYLGGPLLENTTISALDTYIFNLQGEKVRFESFPNTRNDSNPVNFLFTDVNGYLKSANLKDNVESISTTKLNQLFNTAFTTVINNSSTCLGDFTTLSLEDKLEKLLTVIYDLCECCTSTNTGNCSFVAAAIKL